MIRPYRLSDKERLIEIFKLNTPTYFDPIEVLDFEEYLSQNSASYSTIEYENKIVGGVGWYIKDEDKSGRITWIFFHPDASGKGLGREAVEHCFRILKSNSMIEKLVVTTSQLAYKFFEKFDYELILTKKDHWGPGLDLYLMERAPY